MVPEGFAVVLVAATVGLAGILIAGAAYAWATARRAPGGPPLASLPGRAGAGSSGSGLGAVAGGAAGVFVIWAGLSLLLGAHGAFATKARTTFPWIAVGIALPV